MKSLYGRALFLFLKWWTIAALGMLFLSICDNCHEGHIHFNIIEVSLIAALITVIQMIAKNCRIKGHGR